jgi:hypothetical protein
MFDLMAPHEWPFPNPKAPFTCRPQRLRPGGQLTLDMSVPHGSQLTVFPPGGRPVVLIPYGARSFQNVAHLTLVPDTLPHVFADSGVYAITVSTEGELSASLMCRVRYTT